MKPINIPIVRVSLVVLPIVNITSNYNISARDISENDIFTVTPSVANLIITLDIPNQPLVKYIENKGGFDLFLLNGSNPLKPLQTAILVFDGSVWSVGNLTLNANQTVFEDSTTTTLDLLDDSQTTGTFNYTNANINLTNFPNGLFTPYTNKDLSLKITITDNRKEVIVTTKLYSFINIATKVSGNWSYGGWKNTINTATSVSNNDLVFVPLFGDNPIVYDDVFVARTNNVIQTLGAPTTEFTTYANSFWNLKKIAMWGNNNELDGNGILLNIPVGSDSAWVRCLGERWNNIKAYTIPDTITNNNMINLQNSNSYINCPTTTYGSNGVTLEATFDFKNAQPGVWARFFDFGSGSDSDNVLLGSDGGAGIRFRTYNASTAGTMITSNSIINPTANNLYHISVSVSALGYGKIYVNGWLVGEGQSASLRNVARTNCWIGRSNWAADPYLNANVTNIRIWNRALSDVEIKNYFNTSPTGTETGLIAYLPKGTNSSTNLGSLGGSFTLLGTAEFTQSQAADMIGGKYLGHFGAGYRKLANYTPYSGSRKFHQEFHEWVHIPVGSSGKLALISKPNTNSNFWISGVAFSKNPLNFTHRHGVLLHWGLDLERMGKYPYAGGNAAGSNIQWHVNNPWNNDNLIELANNTTQYVMIPVIPNGKDKGLFINAHNGESDAIFPDTITVDGVTIDCTWEPRHTPLTNWYNRRLYGKVVYTKIPASLIGNKTLLPIMFNMNNTNSYLYTRDIGTHDWI